jgi:hypothetical protein
MRCTGCVKNRQDTIGAMNELLQAGRGLHLCHTVTTSLFFSSYVSDNDIATLFYYRKLVRKESLNHDI